MKFLQKNKILLIYLFAVLGLFLSVMLGILLGATSTGIFKMLQAVFSGDFESSEARILIYVRLPRVLATLICGGALAASGAVIQAVLANRLASASIIGVNAGAGLGVVICASFGLIGSWQASLFAFVGAFLTVMLVSVGAKRWGASRGTVILIGVALNAFLGAITDTLTTFFPNLAILSNDFKIGDFSFCTYKEIFPASLIILFSLTVLFFLSNELDVLTLGDESAKGLGLNTGLMRVIFLVLVALLCGASVSVCGLVSFVGLLVPHAIRRVGITSARHLLPLCALFGASFVSICDTISRTIFSPFELPVGIILSFLGAPFFIFLLIKGKGGHRNA